MANSEHLQLLKHDVRAWNEWRKTYDGRPDLNMANLQCLNLCQADFSKTDLCQADFRGAYMSEVSLRGAYVNGANLSEAYLRGADLTGANLSEANLGEAILIEANLSMVYLTSSDLRGADLDGANLSKANLSGADLSGANLSGSDLTEVNFSKSRLFRTIFSSVDFYQSKGLIEIQHRGPSFVELHSVRLPQDGSALHFLRGVGIPDDWIDFYRATMMQPIQYHSCFISYSHHDELLAKRLHADLQDQGVRCWFAPEDMKIGDKIRARIDEAIHLQENFLLLLSEHAIESAWVEDEVESALEKERQQQRLVLFPVRLDEQVMQTLQPWAAKLRHTRHIGDFTHWTDPQVYQQAFERLLRDLKMESNTKGETDGKPGAS